MKKKHSIKCPYCGSTAVLRDAAYVYGSNVIHKHLYVCSKYPVCNAYVGVHEGTLISKGTLANGDLRHKRIEAHRTFDLIWKRGIMTKKNAYRWMQDKFCLKEKDAHIAVFSSYMCDCLIAESQKVLHSNSRKTEVSVG